MAYVRKNSKQKAPKATKEEIEKAAHDMAVFLYDLYLEKKRKESINDSPNR